MLTLYLLLFYRSYSSRNIISVSYFLHSLMLGLFLIPLLLALLTFWLACTVTGEAEQLTLFLVSGSCLLISVVVAPWIVQLLLVVGLLVTPTCVAAPGCSRFCTWRLRSHRSCPHQFHPKP